MRLCSGRRFLAQPREFRRDLAPVEVGDVELTRRRPVDDPLADQMAQRFAQDGAADVQRLGSCRSGGKRLSIDSPSSRMKLSG
jgi:hypothetical protein